MNNFFKKITVALSFALLFSLTISPCVAQLRLDEASFAKLKASFNKKQTGQYVSFADAFDNAKLSEDMVARGMINQNLTAEQRANRVYKPAGYFDHNSRYATFFYVSYKKKDGKPWVTSYLQTLDKSTLEAIAFVDLGAASMSSGLEDLIKSMREKRYTSYIKDGQVMFTEEKVYYGNEVIVESSKDFYLNLERETYTYVKK